MRRILTLSVIILTSAGLEACSKVSVSHPEGALAFNSNVNAIVDSQGSINLTWSPVTGPTASIQYSIWMAKTEPPMLADAAAPTATGSGAGTGTATTSGQSKVQQRPIADSAAPHNVGTLLMTVPNNKATLLPSNLANGTEYLFEIVAQNVVTNSSLYSDTVADVTYAAVATPTIGSGAPQATPTPVPAAPKLSYLGAQGLAGKIDQPMAIVPTILDTLASGVAACGLKSGSLPAGLVVNAKTCVVSGTPTATFATAAATIELVTTAGLSVDAAALITVNGGEPVLSYAGSSGTNGQVGAALTIVPAQLLSNGSDVTGCGVAGGTLSLPTWAHVNATSCALTGIPDAVFAATTYALVAINANGMSTPAQVTISVAAGPPQLSYAAASGTNVVLGAPLSISPTMLHAAGAPITACGVKPGTTALPPGVTVDPTTCDISAASAPTISDVTYTIIAINSIGQSADASITLNAGNGPPIVSYFGSSGTTFHIGMAGSIVPTSLIPNGATVTACGIKPGTLALPTGLSVDPATCIIAGTTVAASAASTYTVVAVNTFGISSDATVVIAANGGAPVLSYVGASGTSGLSGAPLAIAPTILQANGSPITSCGIGIPAIPLPAWASLTATTCIISGTPLTTQAATSYAIVATNANGQSQNAIVTITVNPNVPTLSYSGSAGVTGAIGTQMTVAPTILNNNGSAITGCAAKFGTPALPASLSVNATSCVISGTPTSALGSTAYTLVASNGTGLSADATVTLTVGNGVPTLSFLGSSGTNLAVGQTANVTPSLLATNGAAISACGIKPGTAALPAGLTVAMATCAISGVPTTITGGATYTLDAVNSVGTSADATVTLAVSAGVPILSYVGSGGTSGEQGVAMSVTPSVLQSQGAVVTGCSVAGGSTALPAWASVDPNTCTLTGTPTAALSSTTFSIVAVNSIGLSTPASVTLAVGSGPPTLSYAAAGGTNGSIAVLLSVAPTTFHNNGSAVTSCGIKGATTALPAYLSVDSTSCVISGIPTSGLASTNYTLVALNAIGQSQDAQVTLSIGNGPPSLSYGGAAGTSLNIGIVASISPTTLTANGSAVSGCAIKGGTTALPAGLTVNPTNCVISGTPSAVIASAPFTLNAVNGNGTSADAVVTLQVGPGVPSLSYAGSAGTNGQVGVATTISPTSLLGNGAAVVGCDVAASTTALPSWATINPSTCVITGTPTGVQSATSYSLVAINAQGQSSAAPLTLTIQSGVPALSYALASGTSGSVGVLMTIVPTNLTTGGSVLTGCNIKGGTTALPATLSINPTTCVISGTPTTTLTGTAYTVDAVNANGASADATVTLAVASGVPVLSYAGASGTALAMGQASSIAPTTLSNSGSPIIGCSVKNATTALPSGLVVNGTTCVVSGTPTVASVATAYTLNAVNANGLSADASVTITVLNGAPLLSYTASTVSGQQGNALSIAPTILNNNGSSITDCAVQATTLALPAWTTVDPHTCVITGTPSATQAATSYSIVAQNATGSSTPAAVTIAVTGGIPMLSYTAAAGTTGAVGVGMSVAPTTINNNGAAITACGIKGGTTALPAGLSINATTCTISGTPTATLSATVYTVDALNAVGTSADATVTLTVGSGLPVLSYLGSGGTTMTVASVGSIAPSILNANGSAVSGCGIKPATTPLPSGLSVAPLTCVISGSPTATSSSTMYTLNAVNGNGSSTDATVTLTVIAGVPSLSYSGASGTVGQQGLAATIAPTLLSANGSPITACGVQIPTTALPSWALINASTCTISGTPNAAQSATTYTIIATNAAGQSSTATVAITVTGGAPTLSYASAGGTSGSVGNPMAVAPTTLNNNGSPLTGCGIKASTTALPAGFSVDPSTCVISGTPAGSLSATMFTLDAINANGTSADATVTLSVGNGPPSLSYAGASGAAGTINVPMSVTPTTLVTNGAAISGCGIKASTTALPAGLSVNTTTCVISGTATVTSASATYTLNAFNANGASPDATVTLRIGSGVPVLSYSGSPGTTGSIGQVMSVGPTVLNNNGSPVTACGIQATTTALPAYLTVNAATCAISGTPNASLASTTYTLVAVNSVGASSATQVVLQVGTGVPTLSYLGTAGTSGQQGVMMSVGPTVLNNNGSALTSCTIDTATTPLPAWASVNPATCVISGVPTALLAATAFNLQAINGNGSSADATVTLAVTAGPPSLSYAGAIGLVGMVGTAMSVSPTTFNTNGATTTCALAAGSQAMPAGLALSTSTCVISGTPTATIANVTLIVQASNSAGSSATANVILSTAAFLCDSGDWNTTCNISTVKTVAAGTTAYGGGTLAIQTGGGFSSTGAFNISLNGSLLVQSGAITVANGGNGLGTVSVTNLTVTAGATLSTPITTLNVAAAITVNGGYQGNVINLTAGSLNVNAGGAWTGFVTNLSVTGTVTVGGTMSGNYPSFTAASLNILSGGSLNANAYGFSGGIVPATSPTGFSATSYGKSATTTSTFPSGGAHAGVGGSSTTQAGATGTYDSTTQPVLYGSGGGYYYGSATSYCNGGTGGGAIYLNISGTLTVSGTLAAQGITAANYYCYNSDTGNFAQSGGAGGSLWLNVGSMAGTGTISVAGGNGLNNGGGGGGGYIALYSSNKFPGTFNFSAGTSGGAAAGSGSLYQAVANPCDSGSLAGTCTISTPTVLSANTTLTGSGAIVIASGGSLGPATGATNVSITMTSDFTVQNGGSVSGNFATVSVNNLNVNSGGTWSGSIATLTVAGTATIAGTMAGNYPSFTAANITVSGSLNADGLGFAGGYALSSTAALGYNSASMGQSGTNSPSGGAHAGLGGSSATSYAGGSPVYDSSTAPILYGSGGGYYNNSGTAYCDGGAGGGAIKLVISGTLTLSGSLSAQGITAPIAKCYSSGNAAAGGAGGSLWISTGTIAGSGSISVTGGNYRINGGGGGGGYIAFYSGNKFYGTFAYSGGTSSGTAGGVGSLYTSIASPCDSGTLSGTCTISTVTTVPSNTTISGSGAIVIASGGSLAPASGATNVSINMTGDLTVQNGASVSGTFVSVAANNFNVNSGATWTGNVTTFTAAATATIAGTMSGNYPSFTAANATITGSLNADGFGYAGGYVTGNVIAQGNSGTSIGTSSLTYTSFASGGAHAGIGGSSAAYAGGTSVYGNAVGPTTYGSGGGYYYTTGNGGSYCDGGAGGGAIKLVVSGVLTLSGTLSAQGVAAPTSKCQAAGNAAAAGAGGSLWLNVGSMAGSGTITAAGGSGRNGGGGGGGGYIALFSGNKFSGTYGYGPGTSGGTAGGIGSLYTSITNPCDSGSLTGASCTITTPLLLANGSTLTVAGNLVLASGGSVTAAGGATNLSMAVTGDITVQAGGSVSANFVSLSTNNFNVNTGATWTGNIGSGTVSGTATIAGTMTGNFASLSAATFTISNGGSVNADGLGYAGGTAGGGSGQGPSPGGYNGNAGTAGGAHAGAGGGGYGLGGTQTGPQTTYGTYTAPVTFGSGAAGYYNGNSCAGGPGGGAIKLIVTGTLTIGGTLSANGAVAPTCSYTTSPGSGGAGGSVWVNVGALAGIGTLSVNGGDGRYSGGGGGGGYIALYDSGAKFAGTLSASGGASYIAAGSGRIYTSYTNPCDSGSVTTTCTISTPWILTNGLSPSIAGNVVLAAGANITSEPSVTTGTAPGLTVGGSVTVGSGATITGTIANITSTSMTAQTGSSITATFTALTPGSLTIQSGTTFNATIGTLTATNFTISSGASTAIVSNWVAVSGTLSIIGAQTGTWNLVNAGTFSVSGTYNGNLPGAFMNAGSVSSSGIINADGLGGAGGANWSTPGSGAGGGKGMPNNGNVNDGGDGGSYGGLGGIGTTNGAPTATYGSSNFATLAGSGGGNSGQSGGGGTRVNGTAGGGVIKLVALQSFAINGSIHANGSDGPGATGSGGGIFLDAGSFSGSGAITSRGGNPTNTFVGAGSGGRISIYYRASTYSGAATASAGTGGTGGAGAGTVVQNAIGTDYAKVFVSSASFNGDLLGLSGADTLCANAASAANLTNATWIALVSTSATSASSSVSAALSGLQVMDIWGNLVANSPASLFSGALSSAISFTEYGIQVSPIAAVWTGSTATGAYNAGNDCSDWTDGTNASSGTVGSANSSSSTWINNGTLTCDQTAQLYCVGY